MNLTEAQRAAVESEAPETLCVAPAGSGKTRVLAARIAHLIRDRGVSPWSIMALTFTRRAAGELISRLQFVLGSGADEALQSMLCGTFHAIALKILQQDGGKIGWDEPTLTIIDESESMMLLETCARDLGYRREDKWLKQMTGKELKAILEYEYTGKCQPRSDQTSGPLYSWEYDRLLQRYWQECQQMNVMDFGMILRETSRLFKECPDVLGTWQTRLRHILCDEYQDSDTVLYNLHSFFAPPAQFFAVGDVRQTIYSFRGSRPDLMFAQHPNAKIFNLTESFRCGPAITEAANTLIAVNNEPNCEPMTSATELDDKVEVKTGRSADIAQAVVDLQKQGYAYRDIAVLGRTHRALRRLEDVFQQANIPTWRVKTNSDVTEDDATRDLMMLCRWIVNPKDQMADRAVRRLCPTLDERAQLKVDISESTCVGAIAPRGKAESPTLARLIRGPLAHKSIAEAVRWFALQDPQDDMPEGDFVTLCTVHAAKGLEWPCVIIVGLNEGDFPSTQAIREDADCKEERRLAYVAMTRAKERLVMFWRRPEDQAENRTVSEKSRFLTECGA